MLRGFIRKGSLRSDPDVKNKTIIVIMAGTSENFEIIFS